MTVTEDKTYVCRLCGGLSNVEVFKLTGMPKWNHRLLKSSELTSDRSIDTTVFQCATCGFVSLPIELTEDYYDDYVNAPSLSPQMQAFQQTQAAEFIGRNKLSGKTILEVGCGDGFFLKALADYGAICTGIEPSEAHCAIALERNVYVERGILVQGMPLLRGPFDAFVTRQVFEHVEDMRGFLLAIRENLKETAVGLVEVPNLDKLVNEGRFFDFIPEHLNYFSKASLRLVLDLHGFDVIDVKEVQNGEAISALVSVRKQLTFNGVTSAVTKVRDSISEFIAKKRSSGEKVAIWGAGGKGLSVLAVADLTGVDVLIDGDPNKLGRFTPVSHLQVCSPDVLRNSNISAVIITAPAYQTEIRSVLRDHYRFRGTVAIIEDGLKIVD